MSFSFKYRPMRLKSGAIIYRPIVPLTFDGKEKINIFAIIDSGSDITIIPKEMAEVLGIDYHGDNEISGISGVPIKAKEGKIGIIFGKGREIYNFDVSVIVPSEKEDVPVVIGRKDFFEQFKITFLEFQKRIEFKKAKEFIRYN